MATKTWVRTWQRANDPSAWSLAGAPQPGDTLRMNAGSMTIGDNDLAGDTLTVESQSLAAPTLKSVTLLDGASANVHVANGNGQLDMAFAKGSETLNLSNDVGSGTVLAALAAGATVSGTLTFGPAGAYVFGDAGSTLVNTGNSGFSGDSVVIDTTLAGGGAWSVGSFSSIPGTLDVRGAVNGQAFYVGGNLEKASVSKLLIEHPDQVAGVGVALSEGGEVDLQGLHATDYSYAGNVLRLYDGAAEVGDVTLAVQPSNPNIGGSVATLGVGGKDSRENEVVPQAAIPNSPVMNVA